MLNECIDIDDDISLSNANNCTAILQLHSAVIQDACTYYLGTDVIHWGSSHCVRTVTRAFRLISMPLIGTFLLQTGNCMLAH